MPVESSPILDIHHLGLTVSDIEVSIRFYAETLGLKLLRRREADAPYIGEQTGYPGVRLSVASFQAGSESGRSLEIVQYRNHAGGKSETATNRSGNSHLCFVVSDLEEIFQKLSAQGIRFRSAPVKITEGPNAGGRVIYLYDPDDYVIELFEPPNFA
jgi:catechol 2,3-dioxygenase-like lactoylglutathione lyase family enzyme